MRLKILPSHRDMSYSYMRRNGIKMNFENFYEQIGNWNRFNTIEVGRCENYGSKKCHLVKYESMVSDPEKTIRKITDFLDIEFTNDMLHHDKFLDKLTITNYSFINNGVKRSSMNNGSMGKWMIKIKDYNASKVEANFKLLKYLNYI